MITLKVSELTALMELVKEAVDASCFGPVYQYGGTPEQPTKIVSPLGAQIYANTLNQMLANIDKVTLIEDEKPSALLN